MAAELVVVGGGAAGLAAARAARRHGATVTLVSEGPPGGDCTWTGCVPSKSLLAAGATGADFGAAMDRVRATVAGVAAGEDEDQLGREGIDVVRGRARLVGPNALTVGGRRLAFGRLVLATGARPELPAIRGIDGVAVLTSDDVWDLRARPDSLLVVGGGPQGCELAQAFSRLGVAVDLVEAAGHLLPGEEPAAGAVVARALCAGGVRVTLGASVAEVRADAVGVAAALSDGRTVRATRVLVATGRRPRVDGLDLSAAGVALDANGHVRTDRHLRTTAEGIWAAGDVTGRAPWTHAADEMGRLAAANALARRPWRRFHDERMPSVTYTSPEVARVGVTEEEAARSVPASRIVELDLSRVDRAVTDGRTDGFVKLVVAPRALTRNLAGGRLIGATVVAERAGEMIAVPALLVASGMFPARAVLVTQPYPTWSLGVRQALAELFGGATRPARAAVTQERG